MASRTVMLVTSAIDFPDTRTARLSARSLLPPQVSHACSLMNLR